MDENIGKVEPANGDPVVVMCVCGDGEQGRSLVTVSRGGAVRKYLQNKLTAQVQLPFTIARATANKKIQKSTDIALILLKPKGTFPYMFSAQSMLNLL